MSRPPLEVADIVRAAGEAFIERNRHCSIGRHIQVLRAIRRCRTAALGGHLDECMRCGHRVPISYNSCRDRHCPKCQTAARDRWIAARQKELLPTRYLHIVFTLPGRLTPLVLQNKRSFRSPVPHQCGNPPRSRSRSQTPRRRDWLLQCLAYVEPKAPRSSTCALCRSGRRSLARSHRWIRSRDNSSAQESAAESFSRPSFVDALKEAFQNGQTPLPRRPEAFWRNLRTFAAWLRPLHRQDWWCT